MDMTKVERGSHLLRLPMLTHDSDISCGLFSDWDNYRRCEGFHDSISFQ